ncbi:MAG: PhnD/SsuA/transferrin family substrate-binding protein [Verrucomicrobiales bacterium]|nr:PhnD/SsuA/transferrin family substrate-binding protein [Verrucomicrobiales bacterium]
MNPTRVEAMDPAGRGAICVRRRTAARRFGWLPIAWSAVLALGACGGEAVGSPGTRLEIRFALSSSMFAGVNENDTRAAMKVYTDTIGDQNDTFVITNPELIAGPDAMLEALLSKRAEMFALTSAEFVALEPHGLGAPVLMSHSKESSTEVYVLIVRSNDVVGGLSGLATKSLAIASDVRCCLAPIWLEVLFRENGLGAPERVLSRISTSAKPSQVVLPVFFGKTDACVVTRASFEVMCELNPQTRTKLKIIAQSPPVVPALTCFRSDLPESVARRVLKALELSSSKPAYRQMMQLFKSDGVAVRPLSILDGTRALLARHRELTSGVASATRAAGSESAEGRRLLP